MATADTLPLLLREGIQVQGMQAENMQVDLDDDLFGDGVDLTLPSLPPPLLRKSLYRRIDHLRGRGCARTIAWSKAGTIASITPDGCSLELRVLRIRPSDGGWVLGEPSRCDLVSGTPATPLVHLAWYSSAQVTSTGQASELAVIDAGGRLAILAFPFALNKCFLARKLNADPVNHLHAVVGCYWLPIQSPTGRPFNICYGPAVKSGESYSFANTFAQAYGPYCPIPGRSALVTVNRNGLLRLSWQSRPGKHEQRTIELERMSSYDDVITHAAMVTEKNSLIIALSTAQRQLRIVQVGIDWNLAVDFKSSFNMNPSLSEKHLAWNTWPGLLDASETEAAAPSIRQLSHLELLPSLSDGKERHPPEVLMVRSRLPGLNANSALLQEPISIIDRWKVLSDQKQELHPALVALGTKNGKAPAGKLQATTRLVKLESLVVNKAIIDVHVSHFGRTLVLSYADGSVQYLDRKTMAEIYKEPSADRIMSLRQVGFNFKDQVPCVETAFSPTGCSVLQVGDDGKIKWVRLRYELQDLGTSRKDAPYAATLAALTVTLASAHVYHHNYDDVLAITRPFSGNQRFFLDLLWEFARILKVNFDYTEEASIEAILANGGWGTCLSIVNHVGFAGEYEPRLFSGKLAWVALNLRNAALTTTIASTNKPNAFDEADAVEILAGCVKWGLDLFAWLVMSLDELKQDAEFMEILSSPKNWYRLPAHMQSANNITLNFLLSSSTRLLMVTFAKRLVHLEMITNRAVEFLQQRHTAGASPRSALQALYQKLQKVFAAAPVRPADFYIFLSIISVRVRDVYKDMRAKLEEKARAQSEVTGKRLDEMMRSKRNDNDMQIMFLGTVPPQLYTVTHNMVVVFLPELMAGTFGSHPITAAAVAAATGNNSPHPTGKPVNKETLFFWDFGLLGMQDSERSRERRRTRRVHFDVFRRAEMGGGAAAPGGGWRQCTRCAAVMSSSGSFQKPATTLLVRMVAKCVCNGYWAFMGQKKVAT